MSPRSEPGPPPRRRLEGREAVQRALETGATLRRLVVAAGELPAELEALCRRAEAAGAVVERASERPRERLGGEAEIVALVGADPKADLATVMARGGAVWLLVGAAYAGNVGGALRSAEVSGADGAYVAARFDHEQRRVARRAAMRADRYFPVGWQDASRVLGAARRAGKRIVGIEDSGSHAPWNVDLTGPILLVAGGEALGLPPALLRRCDSVTRIPMAGFLPSYNLQAAVAAIATERLRQLEACRHD